MKTMLFVSSICFLLQANVFAQQELTSSVAQSSFAQSKFKHALNVCPIAPVFGIYAINYEYLLNPKNGVVARFEYESVPKTYTDAHIESSGVAFSLNYRRHLSAGLNSVFFGAYARYRTYEGNGELALTKFDFTLPSFTVGLNVGKRWVWDSGFNMTFSAGYGFSMEDRKATPSSASIESSLDKLEKEYDFMSPFLGEFSVGYAF